MDMLQKFERTPNSYVKRDANYWTKDIREKRAKRKRISLVANDEEPSQHGNLSTQELRQKLKELGIMTRVRKHAKLLELLDDALNP